MSVKIQSRICYEIDHNMEIYDTIEPVSKTNHEERKPTNKSWILFFLFVFIIWVICWSQVITSDAEFHGLPVNTTLHDELYYREKYGVIGNRIVVDNNQGITKNITNCSFYSLFSTSRNEINEITNPINYTMNSNETEKFRYLSFVHQFVHVNSFDPTYFGDCTDKWYPYNFIFTTVVSIFFILSAIFIILTDTNMMVSRQPSVIITVLLFIAIVEHSSELLVRSIIPSLWPYDERLMFWLIPELVALAILLRKKYILDRRRLNNCDNNSLHENSIIVDNDCEDVINTCSHNDSVNKVTDSSFIKDTKKNTEDDNEKYLVYRTIPFHDYVPAMIFGFTFVVIFQFLLTSTMIAFNKIGWFNLSFPVIVICTFYISRTIYYLGLILTSYATNIYIDKKKFTTKDIQHSLFVIIYFHFGTACYHALPSNPIKRNSVFDSMAKKFFAKKYRKYFSLSRVITGTRGLNYADSIEMVLRFKHTTSMYKYFSSFYGISMFLYIILMPSNFLTNVLRYWYFGVFDADLARASWIMYLSITFTFSLVLPFFKAVSDTISFRKCEGIMNKRYEEMLLVEVAEFNRHHSIINSETSDDHVPYSEYECYWEIEL